MINPSAPIGVFDSGLGGLTVLEEIQTLMPHENLLYITDSGYAPYGNKPDTFIIQRALALAEFMVQTHGVKALVVACNTATAAAISHLRQHFEIPVIGMEPGIKPAVEMTDSGVIGVLATENTLKSDKFSNLLDVHHHRARILTQPCHGLVEAIEQGELAAAETRTLLASYVQPLLNDGVDTIVLGCTHYPLLIPLIREIAGDRIHLVSTGAAVARQLKHKLDDAGLCTPDTNAGDELYLTSGEVSHIRPLVAQLFHRDVSMAQLPQSLMPA